MAGVDLFITYQFIRRLVTPFEKWEAFKHGIIDKDGNQLRTRASLTDMDERAAFGYFDILCLNLKKLLAKVPGGQSTFGSYAAALLLLKERPKVMKEDQELLDNLDSILEGYLVEAEQLLKEDEGGAPTNSTGAGAIAGLGVGEKGEPGMGKKKRKYWLENDKETRRILQNVQSAIRSS